MQNYNQYGYEAIKCPQITCMVFLVLSILSLFSSYSYGISLFSSLISIICFATIYYLISKGIQLRNFTLYLRGLIISLIYSILSSILRIILIIILSSYKAKNVDEQTVKDILMASLIISFIFDWLLTIILFLYKKKS